MREIENEEEDRQAAGAEHGIFATGKEFGRAPKRENIRRVRVYAAAYPFSMRSRSSIAGCAAGWKRIASAASFFFCSRVSDANEKTAKMHQEVSSPFPFLLAPGTVDFSFFFWVF